MSFSKNIISEEEEEISNEQTHVSTIAHHEFSSPVDCLEGKGGNCVQTVIYSSLFLLPPVVTEECTSNESTQPLISSQNKPTDWYTHVPNAKPVFVCVYTPLMLLIFQVMKCLMTAEVVMGVQMKW